MAHSSQNVTAYVTSNHVSIYVDNPNPLGLLTRRWLDAAYIQAITKTPMMGANGLWRIDLQNDDHPTYPLGISLMGEDGPYIWRTPKSIAEGVRDGRLSAFEALMYASTMFWDHCELNSTWPLFDHRRELRNVF